TKSETSRRESSSRRTPGRSPPASPNRISFKVLLSQRELNVPHQLTFELKNTFHAQPFFARLCFRQRLLESPHELLPGLNLRILLVGLGFPFERKAFIYFH